MLENNNNIEIENKEEPKIELILMEVSGINIDPFTNMPFVVLKDKEGKNMIPIWIGLIEASAIATKLENIKLTRPMTHDLIKNIFGELHVDVSKIEICDLRDNTYFALLYIKADGQKLVIDSRPSDAIAIALRTGAPIYVSKNVIQKSKQVDLKKEAELGTSKEKWKEILESLTPEDFGKYKM
jgi:bifunctional DNase/RNase